MGPDKLGLVKFSVVATKPIRCFYFILFIALLPRLICFELRLWRQHPIISMLINTNDVPDTIPTISNVPDKMPFAGVVLVVGAPPNEAGWPVGGASTFHFAGCHSCNIFQECVRILFYFGKFFFYFVRSRVVIFDMHVCGIWGVVRWIIVFAGRWVVFVSIFHLSNIHAIALHISLIISFLQSFYCAWVFLVFHNFIVVGRFSVDSNLYVEIIIDQRSDWFNNRQATLQHQPTKKFRWTCIFCVFVRYFVEPVEFLSSKTIIVIIIWFGWNFIYAWTKKIDSFDEIDGQM